MISASPSAIGKATFFEFVPTVVSVQSNAVPRFTTCTDVSQGTHRKYADEREATLAIDNNRVLPF